MSGGATLAAFRVPGYPALWLSSALAAFGLAIMLVAIGWVALEVSDSALAVGATFAARFVPALVLAIPLGGLVDRYDRRRTLIAVYYVGALPLLGSGLLADRGELGLPTLLGMSLLLGVVDIVRGSATQAYAFDLAGAEGATNAIALANLGVYLLGIVGSVAGGLALAQLGVGSAFFLAALVMAAAGVALALIGRDSQRPSADGAPVRVAPSLRRSMTLIVRNRLVALIALVVIVGEIFGFSSLTLYPTFARDVLHSDATGLGVLAAARNVGAVLGLLVLARLGLGGRGGRRLLFSALALGLSLLVFALSSSFALSAVLLVGVGAAAAALDTFGQSLIQRSAADDERGSAMGVWFFAIGFGPFGHLALGAAAVAIGAPLALAISGSLLALTALGLSRVRALLRLA